MEALTLCALYRPFKMVVDKLQNNACGYMQKYDRFTL
jgi:hypothetical protein